LPPSFLISAGTWQKFAWHLDTHYNINLPTKVARAQRLSMIPTFILQRLFLTCIKILINKGPHLLQ